MSDLNPFYADSCPACTHPAVAPLAAVADGDEGIVAGYLCPGCGHAWTCSWLQVPGRVVPPEPTDALPPDLAARLQEQAAINRAHRVPARKERG